MKPLVIGLALLVLALPARAQSQLSLSLSLSFDAMGFSGAEFTASLDPQGLNQRYTLSFDPSSLQEAQLSLEYGGDASPIRSAVAFGPSGLKSLSLSVNLKGAPAFALKGQANWQPGRFGGKFEGQLASGWLSAGGNVQLSHNGIEKLAVSVSATANIESLRLVSTTHATLSGFTQQDFRFETSRGNISLSSTTTFNPHGFAYEKIGLGTPIETPLGDLSLSSTTTFNKQGSVVGEEIGIEGSLLGLGVHGSTVFDAKGFSKAEMNINTIIAGLSVGSSATFDGQGFTSATLTADGIFLGLLLNSSASFDKSGFSSGDLLMTSTLFDVLSLDGQLTLSREGLQYGRAGLSASIGLLTLSGITTFMAGQFQQDISADMSFKF